MDGAGFEPAASTMPTNRRIMEGLSIHHANLRFTEQKLGEFKGFLTVNMRLQPCTAKNTMQDVKRFLEMSNYVISYENVKRYLESYLNRPAKTYNSQITSLRRLIRDYLRLPQLIMTFKIAPVDACQYYEDLPSKEQVRKGFYGLSDVRAKAIYLFTAVTGLRKGEILGLLKSQVNMETHAVIPRHFTRKKRSGITFYNDETAVWLRKHLSMQDSEKLFVISDRQWRKIWRAASESAGVKITSKVLRIWFSTELGERGVPDRYVDVFQGRAPRSVLGKHYTGKGLERLKRIYEKANLTVLA